MEDIDWSHFTRRISVKKEKEVIYDAWITQNSIEKWFLSLAEFYTSDGEKRERNVKIESGDSYKWMWHGSSNVAEGRIIRVGENCLEFTFLGCLVIVEILSEQGENLIELTQKEIPLDDQSKLSYFVGCTRGWTFYLTNLKSILEGGIDLRNKNESLENVINT